MKAGKYSRLAGKKEEMYLPITPLADVLVILLVFLLKGLSLGMANIAPSQNFVLPEGKGEDEVAETLKVEISKELILFEETPIAKLSDFQISSLDLEADGTVRTLNTALFAQNQRSPSSEKKGEISPANQPITMIADASAPYATIRTVIRTLSKRGYPDLKLLVVQGK